MKEGTLNQGGESEATTPRPWGDVVRDIVEGYGGSERVEGEKPEDNPDGSRIWDIDGKTITLSRLETGLQVLTVERVSPYSKYSVGLGFNEFTYQGARVRNRLTEIVKSPVESQT